MNLTALACGAAMLACAGPAFAVGKQMPGMKMPMPMKIAAPAKSAGKKKMPTKKKLPAHKSAAATHRHVGHSAKSRSRNEAPVRQEMMPGMAMPAAPTSAPGGQITMPMPPQSAPAATMTMPMDRQQAGAMGATPMAGMDHGMPAMTMHAALGPYPEQRESSGTAWQPDASSAMAGPMIMSGNWMLMAHGTVNLVYDHQSGARGANKAFVSGMLMGMASRTAGNGTLQLRAMLSPDPLMGPRGYPLLLATGETANGRTPLIDRQHPHDLFMELSASVSQNIGATSSVFVYAGLPGEPAFGPPAFMHRESIMDLPEAPITHHWLDSTHISFGVVTAGLVLDRVKLEVSRFNAREPDQHRWNIETGPLDSTAIRLSWNPTRTVALQGSWGHFQDPEQLEPGVDQKRWSASILYANDVAPGWHLAGTLAWGRKTVGHHDDDAFAAEASVKHKGWTIFGRGEMTENRELLPLEDHGPAFTVGKVSLGAVRDFRIADHFSIGAGGLFSVNFVPDSLAPLYGGDNPVGAMGFVRLKLD